MPASLLRITSAPPGEAPLWVREKWVGVSLPLARRQAGALSVFTSGVLSGPKSFFASIGALLTGRLTRRSGFLVETQAAIAALATSSPEAAAWWQENTPHLLRSKRYFVFPEDVGQVVSRPGAGKVRADALKPFLKVAVVAGGYIAAFLIASAAVAVRIATTSGPDAQASSGMYAAGDAFLFVAVFGMCALVPTGAALFFLRPYRRFWTVLSALGLAVAVTGVTAAILFLVGRQATAPSTLAMLAGLSVLRILIAPLLALAFLVCTLFSPYRSPRFALLAASAMEIGVSAYGGLVWFVPLLFNRP